MAKASDVLKELNKKLQNVTDFEKKSFDFLLDEIPQRIIRRTLLGKDINNVKFKELSPKYIEFRKKFSGLSTDGKPKKSNLTLTGHMLSSIEGKRDGSLFTFFFKDSFADKKAGWVAKAGRVFFNLSITDKKGLQTKISGILRRKIREAFN